MSMFMYTYIYIERDIEIAIDECMYVWMQVCLYICMHVCMNLIIYVCMYLIIYVCMNARIYICMCILISVQDACAYAGIHEINFKAHILAFQSSIRESRSSRYAEERISRLATESRNPSPLAYHHHRDTRPRAEGHQFLGGRNILPSEKKTCGSDTRPCTGMIPVHS